MGATFQILCVEAYVLGNDISSYVDHVIMWSIRPESQLKFYLFTNINNSGTYMNPPIKQFYLLVQINKQ